MTLGTALLVIRLLLAATLGLAAVAKLRDPAGSRRAFHDFQIPRALIPATQVLLPGVELLIGAGLLFQASALAAAVAAVVLFGLFAAVLLASLARGRKPPCHCFGKLDTKPIGWRTIARTGVLEAGALVVVLAGWQDVGPGVFDSLVVLAPFERAMAAGGAVILALLAVQSLQLAGLRRELAALRAGFAPGSTSKPADEAAGEPAAPAKPPAFRWPSPAIGTPAPHFALPSADGTIVTLDALRARGNPVAVVFTGVHCGGCRELFPDIRRWQQDESTLTVALISRGSEDASRALAKEHGLPRVLFEKEDEVSAYYGAVGTPSALIVKSDGTVATDLAAGVIDVRRLVSRFVPDAPALPAAAPEPVHETARPSAPLWEPPPPEPVAPHIDLPIDAQPVKDECVDDELLADGSMVLYNRCRHQALTLNPTAALVWESCDGQRDVPAIANELRDVFGSESGVEAHVRDVLDQLLQERMISLPVVDAVVSEAAPAANA